MHPFYGGGMIMTQVAAQASTGNVAAYESKFRCMGTIVSLKKFTDDEIHVRRVFQETRAEIDRLVQIFTY
jgi:hypothetical protein